MGGDSRPPWHALSVDDVLSALGSGLSGLSGDEAAARLKEYGLNQLKTAPPVSVWKLFLDEFRSPLILILLASAVLLFFVTTIGGGPTQIVDAALILLIVVFNCILGFIQNYRAHRGIEALKRLADPQTSILRDGHRITAEAAALVPGDIVSLEEGNRAPADGRLIEVPGLNVDEWGWTGESSGGGKTLEPFPENTSLAERANMVYMGTTVMRGRGRFAVTETGMATEVGKIAEEVQATEERPTPFHREVAELGKRITAIVGVLIALIAALQLTLGRFALLEAFVAAVALAVAAIPEGLPVVLTLALAFGTREICNPKGLACSLAVVEVLGRTQ